MKANHVLVLFILLVSGCLGPSAEKPTLHPIAWGLGIAMTGGPFPPAPFAEPPSEIRKLRDFLANTTNELMDICDSSDRGDIEGYLPYGYYLDALQSVPDSCNSGGSFKARQMAEGMIANGSVDSDLDRLRSEAQQRSVESRSLLESLPPRGSIVDLEVLAVLFNTQGFVEGALESSKLYQQSFHENGQLINLQAAVLNAIDPERIARISLPWIVENYPWSTGTCKPDLDAIEAQLRGLMAEMEKTPRPDRGIDEQGRLWDEFRKERPLYNRTLERHQLHSELSNIATLSWKVTVVRVESPLPTRAEGQYLFDTYRNQTRTLLTDRFLQNWLLDGLEDYHDSLWMQYGKGKAAYAKAVFSMDWPIEALHCSV